jgi:hypothetical protein
MSEICITSAGRLKNYNTDEYEKFIERSVPRDFLPVVFHQQTPFSPLIPNINRLENGFKFPR